MIQFAVIVVLLVCAAFFVLIARSFHHVSHHHLEEMAEESGQSAQYEKYLASYDRMQGAAAILGGVLEGGLVVMGSAALIGACGETGAAGMWTIAEAIVLAVILMGLVCEGLTEIVARVHAESIVLKTSPVMSVISIPFEPIHRLDHWLDSFLRGAAGQDEEEFTVQEVTDEILSAVTEGEQSGALDDEAGQMIEGVISLGQADVAAVMTPRTEIVGIRGERRIDEALDLALSTGHSRLPVFETNLDNIVVVALLNDLMAELRKGEKKTVREIMRPAYYVPESKGISDLLRELRERKMHTAIVLDEYGGTAGLVTVEDILEEIVGEIVDEHDRKAEQPIRRVDAETVEVGPRCAIEELNEELGLELPENPEYETVTGFVLHMLERIPSRGETFEAHGARFEVLEADERSIGRLRVRKLPGVDD